MQTLEVVPLRADALHVNVLKFLEQGVPYLKIKNLVISTGNIEVDVEITHPFPGYSTYTGFDVRGVFITPGTATGYNDTGIIHPYPSETFLTNSDGWTRWWNPSEFPVGTNIFGYRDGKLGNKYNGSNLNATLNAYKYFCDDLKASDGLEKLIPAHRGMFQHGWTNERHYSIHFDPASGLVFNYAVDASWEPPDPDPPIGIPGDFPPGANGPEAYRIVTSIVENDLFFVDAVNKGGHAVVSVGVYDWWGCDDTVLSLDAPGTWFLEEITPIGGTAVFSTYHFDLDGNLLNSSNSITALITATSVDATYGLGDIASDNVATYAFLTIPIKPTADPPTVTSIDPDNEYINEVVSGAVVEGTNFANNAQVTLIDDATGTITIEATNEVITGGTSITCDIDLTDPSIQPGKYDVRVTNPDTGLWGELDKGFTVDDLAHPWPGWRAAGLCQAASDYVGYGDATAATAPKWVFPENIGGTCSGSATAGCAVANDGTVYLNTVNSAMYAVNPDGTLKWTFQPQTPWICQCPCIDLEGYVYVTMGSSSADYLYKVNPETGGQVWSCYLGNSPCYPGSPAVGADGGVYCFTGSILSSARLHRVEPDGTYGWYITLYSFAYSYSWPMGVATLPNGNVVASGGSTGEIFCLEPDGDIAWEYQSTSWTLLSLSVGPEGNVYFTTWYSPGTLWALDSDGDFLWSADSGYFQWASPAVDPNTGNIFVGHRTGHFRCFEPDGDVVWDHDFAGSNIDGSAAIDANGDVYVAVGNQPGNPYRGLVKMDGETGDVIWQADDIGYMITTSPSIGADGTIYLPGYSTTKALFAYGE